MRQPREIDGVILIGAVMALLTLVAALTIR